MKSRIYFDNNATTPLFPEVLEVMKKVGEASFGNPSSIHWAGREGRACVNRSREKIAALLGAEETEILFTSGGTESINTALCGVFERRDKDRFQILSSPIEHHATLKTLEYLWERGAEIVFLAVDRQGRIDVDEVKERVGPKTLLVSLMFANNETGNLFPIETVGSICRERGVPFHCDGVQAVGKVPVSLKDLPVDLFSFSAHKFHGPKGVGGLYVRSGVDLAPLHRGGRQERGLRAGTENVAAIAGMTAALEISLRDLEPSTRHVLSLRKKLEEGLLSRVDGIALNGDASHRVPNTTNLRVEGVDGESLLFNLDLEGIAASAGAACESGSLDPSHVLLAMGFTPEQAKASVRFSLSRFNTEEEVEALLRIFPAVVGRLRKS
jgi:cysteine desulfurase